MAYSAILTSEVTSGKAVKETFTQKVKDNFDNHQTRILALEAGPSVLRPLSFYAPSNVASPTTGYKYLRLNYDLTIVTSRLILWDAGTSGTLEVDVLYKRGASAFASIYSAKPSIAYTSAQFSTSPGTVSFTSLLAGDLLRLDVTSVMVGCDQFELELEYTV